MINVHLKVRRAVLEDHLQVANLGTVESNTHRHLDWRSALDWLGADNYWVLEESGAITAALACPEEPTQMAWIRFFGYAPHLSAPEAWSALWSVARSEIFPANQNTQVAAIIVKPWFQRLLLSSGFELKQNIVLMQLAHEKIKTFSPPAHLSIRPMRAEDLPIIAKIDSDAFGPFWHNTLDSLSRARSQSTHATVAEDDSGVVGYQLSTGNPLGAHLARLGVSPEAQGKGVGTALVNDLIHRLGGIQLSRLSVNTQDDNAASLSLYKKMGFVPTGEHFPVLVFNG
ncbi:MAG: GNAT family N-acetyltransferase [Chloroflexi bacterium]|nr:GNAT family N-acetyltransferase [Chloroflexota bacterium]